MSKLSWTYDDRSGEERAEYCGLRIRAVRDDHPHNPLEDRDGLWPMIVCAGRSSSDFTYYADGDDFKNPISLLSDAQIVHDQMALASICGDYKSIPSLLNDYLTFSELDEKFGEDVRPSYCRDGDLLRQALELSFGDNVPYSEMLEKIAEVLTIAGVHNYQTTVHGYSQGDWAEVLVIAPQAKIDEFGIDIHALEADAKADPAIRNVLPDPNKTLAWINEKVSAKLMESQADLYAAWAFGDVYGYIVEKPVRLPDADPDDEPEWEEVEDGSCWGYYGTDHDKSGLEEQAISSADHHLASQKRKREAKLKALITNRTPLDRRARILEEAL